MAANTLTERQRFWLEHLRACEKSGLAMTTYAERHGLAVSSLYMARSRLRASGPVESDSPKAATFVRVEPRSADVTTTSPRPCRVNLPNGVTVELGVDGNELGTVLRAAAAL